MKDIPEIYVDAIFYVVMAMCIMHQSVHDVRDNYNYNGVAVFTEYFPGLMRISVIANLVPLCNNCYIHFKSSIKWLPIKYDSRYIPIGITHKTDTVFYKLCITRLKSLIKVFDIKTNKRLEDELIIKKANDEIRMGITKEASYLVYQKRQKELQEIENAKHAVIMNDIRLIDDEIKNTREKNKLAEEELIAKDIKKRTEMNELTEKENYALQIKLVEKENYALQMKLAEKENYALQIKAAEKEHYELQIKLAEKEHYELQIKLAEKEALEANDRLEDEKRLKIETIEEKQLLAEENIEVKQFLAEENIEVNKRQEDEERLEINEINKRLEYDESVEESKNQAIVEDNEIIEAKKKLEDAERFAIIEESRRLLEIKLAEKEAIIEENALQEEIERLERKYYELQLKQKIEKEQKQVALLESELLKRTEYNSISRKVRPRPTKKKANVPVVKKPKSKPTKKAPLPKSRRRNK